MNAATDRIGEEPAVNAGWRAAALVAAAVGPTLVLVRGGAFNGTDAIPRGVEPLPFGQLYLEAVVAGALSSALAFGLTYAWCRLAKVPRGARAPGS